MTNTEILDRTRAYVRENFLYARAEAVLDEHEDLLAGGVIDSVGVLELVEFLQDEFDVSIGPQEITESNLGSLAAIVRFVDGKAHQAIAGEQPRLAG